MREFCKPRLDFSPLRGKLLDPPGGGLRDRMVRVVMCLEVERLAPDGGVDLAEPAAISLALRSRFIRGRRLLKRFELRTQEGEPLRSEEPPG